MKAEQRRRLGGNCAGDWESTACWVPLLVHSPPSSGSFRLARTCSAGKGRCQGCRAPTLPGVGQSLYTAMQQEEKGRAWVAGGKGTGGDTRSLNLPCLLPLPGFCQLGSRPSAVPFPTSLISLRTRKQARGKRASPGELSARQAEACTQLQPLARLCWHSGGCSRWTSSTSARQLRGQQEAAPLARPAEVHASAIPVTKKAVAHGAQLSS